MKIALYQIEQEYISLANQIIDNEGELSEELETALQINQDQLEAKGKGYGYIIKDIEAEIDAIDVEIAKYIEENKALEILLTTYGDSTIRIDWKDFMPYAISCRGLWEWVECCSVEKNRWW